MIAKTRDNIPATNTLEAKAEEQMAFYLRRAFPDTNQDIIVYNDLRLVDARGEVAQFDHLILHRRGFIVIESKSVTSEVKINAHGEWQRKWNGHWHGMPSPIKQAERQIEVLKNILSENRAQLRGKMLGRVQIGFGATPFDILIAISDRGIIQTDASRPSEVHKAESIVDALQALLKQHNRMFTLSVKSGMEKYSDQEFTNIANFLAKSHVPRNRASFALPTKPTGNDATQRTRQRKTSPTGDSRERTQHTPHAGHVAETPAPYAAAPPQSTAAHAKPTPQQRAQQIPVPLLSCSHCNSTRVTVKFARTYYAHCNDCEKNAPVNYPPCPQCGEPTKTRKQGNHFFRNFDGCDACPRQGVFHQN